MTTVMTHIEAGASIPEHWHTQADETVYVVSGDFVERGKSYGPGSFFVGKAGTSHVPTNCSGCTVLTTFSAPLDFRSAIRAVGSKAADYDLAVGQPMPLRPT